MTLPANIRVNIGAPFPSQVKGQGIIAVSKRNGIWTVTTNFAAVAKTPVVPDPANTYSLVWNALTGVLSMIPAVFLNMINTWTARQNFIGTDAAGSGNRYYRSNDIDYTEIFKSAAGLGATSDPLNFYTSSLAAVCASLGREGTWQVTGAILSQGATKGIGYAAGAGGTIAQAASKSTGVVLNTVCGQITMNNANLNAATIVSFVLTNSAIAATDVLILNHISGGTPGSYSLNARCAAGSATIDVRNNTAGNLGEAIVIQFALVKAINA